MKKAFKNGNVYDAAMDRLRRVYDEFEHVCISFSGGKDSGVMMNLAFEVAREKGRLKDTSLFHIDYEAQYQMTTDYVERTYYHAMPSEVTPYWFCLPIKAQCATSMFQSYWQPWKLEDRDKWCRDLPDFAISEETFNLGFDYEASDYRFVDRFSKLLARKKTTCFLVGIRTQESLHRYKAVNKTEGKNEYNGYNWTTQINKRLINAYPIYDWNAEDVWIANGKFSYDYNRLYDLMHTAGLSLNQMRVASPFNDAAGASLKLYKQIDPNNWGKLIGRVNGVNFTGLYGGTTAMGWNKITKPKHFTWKQYMEFLLDTLPEETRNNYIRKLKVSLGYWLKDGGALPEETVQELETENLDYEDLGKPTSKRNYTKPYRVIRFKDYLEETNLNNPNLLPTYKRMCIAIMKNDTSCKTLGFGQTKDELARRQAVVEKYKNL